MLIDTFSIYSQIIKNPIKKIEKFLNGSLEKWLDKKYINKIQFHSLKSSADSFLSKAYGLPKIHKENLTYRIIVSSINTVLYKMGAYLQKVLSENVPKPDSFVLKL